MTPYLIVLSLVLAAAVGFLLWRQHARERKAWLIYSERNELTRRARLDEREQLRELEASYRLSHSRRKATLHD